MLVLTKNIILISLLLPKILRMASVFVTHGGGPFPILQKQQHAVMYKQFQAIQKKYPNPKAIIIFSAHWEENEWTILDEDQPSLLYDYYGFPPQSYNLTYPIRSSMQLREDVKQKLLKQGVGLKTKTKRGYDHGVFIPLMIMYPKANIPVIQISILKSLNPQAHYRMGVALRGLKNDGYLILGSGASIHGGFFQQETEQLSKIFDSELSSICLGNHDEKLLQKIKNWKSLKYSKYLHPREQHLVPLFINLGASQGKLKQQMKLFIMGVHLSNYVFQ